MIRNSFLLLIIISFASCKPKTMFSRVDPSDSGIQFNNLLDDTDSLNVLDVENIYNGGGVGIGDFNNDGLMDIYFTGNMVENKLYLNKGDFEFEDITAIAQVTGEGRWGRGVSVVDINSDGLPDIYVSASLSQDSRKRENLLYINKGKNPDGIPIFENQAREYGLADTAHSTMAAFFDYDNDGDLDMYLLVNEIVKHESPNNFRPQQRNREHPNTDRLFRNDFNDSLGHPVFTDVSVESGITIEGFGHGINIVDLNKDGWKDIYVSNDFLSQNLLYINQKNGTFKNEIKDWLKHTAENAMGQDVIDINNDGLADIIELDMNPEDNFRKKMMMNPIGYQRYVNNDYFGYQYQYVRNVLQLNQGPKVGENDSIGHPVFADISFIAGVAETDWSWTPSVADFDNDGFRDLIVTNGFPRDVTDHDFMAYRNKSVSLATKKEVLEQIPEVKISNYAFKNNGDLSFKNVTKDWGLDLASFSNGAAYADLDNDGDLDYVINNINDIASVYRNNASGNKELPGNYLNISLAGKGSNRNGFGTWIEIFNRDGSKQFYENTPYRGYLSSVTPIPHFGLGSRNKVDSLVIKWPSGKMQVLKNIASGQTLIVKETDAAIDYSFRTDSFARGALFTEVTSRRGMNYVHPEQDFIDFNIQNLLPHKLSEYGPALASADLNGDGLDDIVSGGSFFHPAQIFLQQKNGSFLQRSLPSRPARDGDTAKNAEDMGVLVFDADNDGDQDIYIARGGYESPAGSPSYRDVFLLNDGKGEFSIQADAIPTNLVSKSCVRAADIDNDGDLDLFVAGRVEPGRYPRPVSSFIYRNDSKNGQLKFTDISRTAAASFANAGMICDALFTDFDGDGWRDLVIAGEWMQLSFFKNKRGVFENITKSTGVGDLRGWWNSIVPGDFDNDGDIDYIAGNFGTNSLYKPSTQYPVYITANDFDNNGSFDAIPSYFIPQSYEDQQKREVPVHLRDDMIKQIVKTRAKFKTYKEYANARIQDVLSPGQIDSALRIGVNELRSMYIENKGNGRFEARPLPMQAQISILNGIVVEDFDGDGNLDLVAAGNDFGTDLVVGKYDASNGLYLHGDGKGNFVPVPILQSGVYLPGNTKSLVQLRGANDRLLLAVSENRGRLRLIEKRDSLKLVPVQRADMSAIITLKDGRKRKVEFNFGSSFLSQSARFVAAGNLVSSVEVIDNNGKRRGIVLR